MDAAQMVKEFDIAYEDIASSGAPGYEPYEKSILLTQAQNQLLEGLIGSGAERTDIRSLVVGPFIKTDSIDGFEDSQPDPGFTSPAPGDSIVATWFPGGFHTTFSITQAGPTSMISTGTFTMAVNDTINLVMSSLTGGIGATTVINIDGCGISETISGYAAILAFALAGGETFTATSGGTLTVNISSQDAIDNGFGFHMEFILNTAIFTVSDMYSEGIVFDNSTSDMWLIVNERLEETDGNGTVEVKPVDHTFIDANIDNPFKKPDSDRFFWRVLQYGSDRAIPLYSTPNFLILGLNTFHKYYINYLERPKPIFVPGCDIGDIIDGITIIAAAAYNDIEGIGTGIDIATLGLDCQFNSLIHRDIINKAAKLGAAYVSDPESFQLLLNSYKEN